MIISENESNVTMSGQMEIVEFEIKTDDAKMFHILSNLYSDPLGAVVREISTNCCDGHKIKGNVEVPFDIILPGYLDMGNFISFRDYGPGMTHQNIKDIYTKFGQSTKVNSNDQTGCLGLGSKSPLAITSSFNVTSICDGIKTVYAISKDNYGKPNLAVFGTSPSTEENGLLVTVPLTGQYVDKVIDSIKDELKYFKVKPRIMKGSEEDTSFKWADQFESFFELIPDEFYITKRETRTHSTIIQGEIGYSFSSETLMKMITKDETIEDNSINDKMQVSIKTYNLLKNFYDKFSLKLFSAMGTISFAPNREELIYDTVTSKNLIRSTIKAIKSIHEVYINAYSYVRNPFEFESLKAYNSSLKTDNILYKNFISRFGFDFSKSFGIENFILQDGSTPFADGIKSIRYYKCFDNIEQITFMQKKMFEEGFILKKQVKLEKHYKNSRYCESIKNICGSNQDDIHIVFISGEKEYKFAKKHLANYYNFFNEKTLRILIVELKYMSQITIEEFIMESGLSKGFSIPFSDVLGISAYQTEQEKLSGVVKDAIKIPYRQITLRKSRLNTLPGKIEWFDKFDTDTTTIREVLTGIYIPTHNNEIVYSTRLNDKYPEIHKLYKRNETKSFFDIMLLLNEIGGITDSKMNTMVYTGNEKYFSKSKLVHFEDFLLQHITSVKLLNSLLSAPKIINILDSMTSQNRKIMQLFEIYDVSSIGPVIKEHVEIRKAIKEKMVPFNEWFYDKDSRFLLAFDLWKKYRNNKIVSDIVINSEIFRQSEKNVEVFNKFFNIEIISHRIDDLLLSSFKDTYNYKFESIRPNSSINNSYMTTSNEIELIQDTLEDINTLDYIRINVKEIKNFPMLPTHSCKEPPPPTEEELAAIAREKELARMRKENEMIEMYLEVDYSFNNVNYFSENVAE